MADKHDDKKNNSPIKNIATKPFRLPLNWVLPRAAVGGVKEFKFSNSRFPVCPNCSMGRFVLEDKKNENGYVVWSCPKCDFHAFTKNGTTADIQQWYHVNAKEVFNTSDYNQRRMMQGESDDSFLSINIRRNMVFSYAFLLLSFVLFLLFLYAAWTVNLFFLVNTLLFTAASLLMGLVFNYRAWQAQTSNLYNPDGKQQFHWWVKHHPWFRSPMDIGVPPNLKQGPRVNEKPKQ